MEATEVIIKGEHVKGALSFGVLASYSSSVFDRSLSSLFCEEVSFMFQPSTRWEAKWSHDCLPQLHWGWVAGNEINGLVCYLEHV